MLSDRSGSRALPVSMGPSDWVVPLVLLGDGLGELVELGLGKSGVGVGVASGDGLAGAAGFEGAQALILTLILRLNKLSIKPRRCRFAQTIWVLRYRFIKSLQLETEQIRSRTIAQSG